MDERSRGKASILLLRLLSFSLPKRFWIEFRLIKTEQLLKELTSIQDVLLLQPEVA
jgi:hypothetical protein